MKEGHSFAADTALQIPWDISGMRLGRGYAIEEGQVRQSALNIFQVINPDHEPNIKYEYISIDNEDEMQREINSSLNASASVFGIGIKAAFEQLQDIKCSSRSTTTILRCTIVSGPFQYDNDPTFSQEAMTLLQAQPPKIDQFLATYGSYFVAGYQKTSSLSAISTYNATDKDSLNKFKGDLNVGKGIASCRTTWQSTGITPTYLVTDPSPETITDIFQKYTTCKPQPQIALLEHYSLINSLVPRSRIGSSEFEKIKKTTMDALRVQNKLQECSFKGAAIEGSQAYSLGREVVTLRPTTEAWDTRLKYLQGELTALEGRLALWNERSQFVDFVERNARKDWFREFKSPEKMRTFDFGYVGNHAIGNGALKNEIQYWPLQDCHPGSVFAQTQKRQVLIYPTNAKIVGFRVHSYWDDGSNGPFKISKGGVLDDKVEVSFETQPHRGGHWAVEAWYVDSVTYAQQD
ncbi:unnamed protein product [Alternaria alternata]